MKTKSMSFSILLLFSVIITLGACKTAQTKKEEDPNFLGNYPPQSLGAAHLNIVKRFTNDLIPRDISFVFEPRSNSLKFHHRLMSDNIWVYLSKQNRAEMRNAINAYLDAFSKQALTPEGAKKKGAFGTSDILMTWGIFGSAHEAAPTLRYDYQFITPQRPYFILATATTKGKGGGNSPAIRIAVSPAQCEDLRAVLNEEGLMAIVDDLKADYDKFDTNKQQKKSDTDNTALKEEQKPFDQF